MTESEKRPADHDDEDRPAKRERGPLVQLRILIPASAAGPIIGSKGDNLKRIKAQCKSGAHNIIRVADSPNTPERILMVSCHPDDIEKIILHVGPEIFKALPSDIYREDEISILIPNDQAGPVIGKSGSNIAKMRTESGSKVRIYKDKLPFSDERILLIQGSLRNIAQCVVIVCDFLLEFPVVYQYTQYSPQSERSDSSLDCGGYTLLGDTETATSNHGNIMSSYTTQTVDLRQNLRNNNIPQQTSWSQSQQPVDPATQLQQLQQQISQLQQQIQPQQSYSSQYSSQPQGVMMQRSYSPPPPPARTVRSRDKSISKSQQPRISDNPDLDIKKSITIPEEFTSSLIGPKGSNITSIRHKAKAKIFIVNDKDADAPRAITLSGNVRGVQHAEHLIEASLEEIERQKGYSLLSERQNKDVSRVWDICTAVSGAIIGEKGARISVIRQHSGAQVHIEKEDDTKSTLTLTGTLQNIRIAEELIADAMDPSQSTDHDNYTTDTFDNNSSYDYQMTTDAQYADFQNQVNSFTSNLSNSYTQNQPLPYSYSTSTKASDEGTTIKMLQFDDKHTGALIGTKGTHIGSMRQQSGCDIQIDTKEKPINGQRTCTITGNPANVQYAESIIEGIIGKSI